jgi:lipoprotein-anchoring transpeptidase ErfK/SrfK
MEYSIVFRSANSFSIVSALLLVNLVAVIPTGLHAEPNSSPPKATENNPKQEVTPPQTAPVTPVQKNGAEGSKQPSPRTQPQPPVTDTVNLLLNLKQRRVYVYKGDKVIAKYPVAIGKKGWETPLGEWQVMEKVKNPGWTNFKTGEVMKPGKENPLGVRWIGFWTDGEDVIGFHGTPNIKSIGTAASHGCVRMFNRDVRALYLLVKVGTTVKVVAQ